jgi:hypothetical protein
VKKILLFGLLELSTVIACDGALEWKTTRIALDAHEGRGLLEAHFPFRNTGPDIVIIERVESSCACTMAHVSASQFAPGETGEIRAVFGLAGRAGPSGKDDHGNNK